jgi:hypothetical protein
MCVSFQEVCCLWLAIPNALQDRENDTELYKYSNSISEVNLGRHVFTYMCGKCMTYEKHQGS